MLKFPNFISLKDPFLVKENKESFEIFLEYFEILGGGGGWFFSYLFEENLQSWFIEP